MPTDTPLTASESQEWMSAAMYFARAGRLPDLLSAQVALEIERYPDEWAEDVSLARYARAMATRP